MGALLLVDALIGLSLVILLSQGMLLFNPSLNHYRKVICGFPVFITANFNTLNLSIKEGPHLKPTQAV